MLNGYVRRENTIESIEKAAGLPLDFSNRFQRDELAKMLAVSPAAFENVGDIITANIAHLDGRHPHVMKNRGFAIDLHIEDSLMPELSLSTFFLFFLWLEIDHVRSRWRT